MEVHRELGCGFLEPVYQETLDMEFKNQEIPFKAQPVMEYLIRKPYWIKNISLILFALAK